MAYPILPLDQCDRSHLILQEALLSAFVITIYVMLNDTIHGFLVRKHVAASLKYFIIFVSMFLSTFSAIMLFYYVFGYRSQ